MKGFEGASSNRIERKERSGITSFVTPSIANTIRVIVAASVFLPSLQSKEVAAQDFYTDVRKQEQSVQSNGPESKAKHVLNAFVGECQESVHDRSVDAAGYLEKHQPKLLELKDKINDYKSMLGGRLELPGGFEIEFNDEAKEKIEALDLNDLGLVFDLSSIYEQYVGEPGGKLDPVPLESPQVCQELERIGQMIVDKFDERADDIEDLQEAIGSLYDILLKDK